MIYVGADHKGFELKEKIKSWLTENGFDYEDVGAFELNPEDDYPDFAKAVAEKITNPGDRGIIICGSGVGVDEVANKFAGVRSGLAINAEQIKSARHDDDINVLALAADYTPPEEALIIAEAFLRTGFSEEEKYKKRIDKLETRN